MSRRLYRPGRERDFVLEMHKTFVVEGGGRWHDVEPACDLCGTTEQRLRRIPGQGWVCAWAPPCTYRARVRDGMPKWRALNLLEAEKTGRPLRVPPPKPQERGVATESVEVRSRFCTRHKSFFCPCVSPGMYEDDAEAASFWEHPTQTPRLRSDIGDCGDGDLTLFEGGDCA